MRDENGCKMIVVASFDTWFVHLYRMPKKWTCYTCADERVCTDTL